MSLKEFYSWGQCEHGECGCSERQRQGEEGKAAERLEESKERSGKDSKAREQSGKERLGNGDCTDAATLCKVIGNRDRDGESDGEDEISPELVDSSDEEEPCEEKKRSIEAIRERERREARCKASR